MGPPLKPLFVHLWTGLTGLDIREGAMKRLMGSELGLEEQGTGLELGEYLQVWG